MTSIIVKSENGETQRGLIFTKSEWNNLHYKIHKNEIEAKAEAERLEDLEKRKKMSREMTSDWENTIVKMRKRRFEQRHERLKQIEKKIQQKYVEIKKEKENLIKDSKAKAEELLYEQSDSSKSLASALKLAEMLRVRGKQVELENKWRNEEKEKQLKYDQQILEDVKKYQEEQEEIIKKHFEHKLKMKEEFYKQAIESQKQKEQEKREKFAEERKNLKKGLKEMEMIEEEEKKEWEQKRRKMWDDIIENRQMVEEQKLLKQKDEEEENKAIHLISEAKKKICMIRYNKEMEMKKAAVDQRNKISKELSLVQDNKKEEEACFQKARGEIDNSELERMRKEKEHIEKLAQERRQINENYLMEAENKKTKEKELLKWEILKLLKKEEVDKEFKQKLIERKIDRINANKEAWKKQVEENAEREKKEKEENDFSKQLEIWKLDDKKFFEYASNILKDSKESGRPSYPMEKVIEDYKKKFGLIERKSKHPLFTSKVPVNHESKEPAEQVKGTQDKREIENWEESHEPHNGLNPKCSCQNTEKKQITKILNMKSNKKLEKNNTFFSKRCNGLQ